MEQRNSDTRGYATLLKMGSLSFIQDDQVLTVDIYLHTGYSGTGIWFEDINKWVLTRDGWDMYRTALEKGTVGQFAKKLKKCFYENQAMKLNF